MLLLRITKIINETEQCKSFYLSHENDDSLVYKAGQFLTLLLDINNKEIRRSYSFGSAPGIDKEPFITVKRVVNGAVSRFMLDHLKEGDLLTALAPAGRFINVDVSARLRFFVAAGSGIVPVFSLIKEILHQGNSKVVLVYQNTNEQSSIYRSKLLQLHDVFKKRFRLIELFSQPIEGIHLQKRLNNYLFEQHVRKEVFTKDVMFYTCGPLQLMRMVNFTLRAMGYRVDQVKKETFVIESIPTIPFIKDISPKQVIIHLNNKTYKLQVTYPQSILDAALKNNIQLPYSCKAGRCSTCTARCVQGKIKMSINEVLTEKDLNNGLVLTCVGYPETDVELIFEH